MSKHPNPRSGIPWILASLIVFGAALRSLAEDPAAGGASLEGIVAPKMAEDAISSLDPAVEEVAEQLKSMSLMDLVVTSVSKHEEKQFDAAAAIYVISNEDIRRSGARNFAEALRMSPGLTIGQIDSNKWGISSRGFTDRFSDKLLVLIDGRSVYTPTFSGVFWDAQNYPLQDVERIEVIRGPGGTLWGANAVNGVINIITKDAAESQGAYFEGGWGDPLERVFGDIRYGGQLGEAHYRVYFDYFEKDGTPIEDSWNNYQTGFRIDWDNVDEHFTFQGDYYWGNRRQITNQLNPGFVPVPETGRYVRSFVEDFDVSGGNVLGRYTKTFSADSELIFQVYYDYVERGELRWRGYRHTADAELQYRFSPLERHSIVSGLGYRVMPDHFDNPDTFDIVWDPAETNHQLFSGFLQDEIELIPDVARFIIGTKVEHNDYTGWEIQPNARLTVKPSENQTLWGAVSRAVHVPERNLEAVSTNLALEPGMVPVDVNGDGIPDTLLPLFSAGNGRTVDGEMVDSTELLGWEAGYRIEPVERVSVDVAGFYNQYDNLVGAAFTGPDFRGTPVPHLLLTSHGANNGEATTYGTEVSINVELAEWWRVSANYSWLRMDFDDNAGLFSAGKDPEQQFNIRSSWDVLNDFQIDVWWRYVDQLRAFNIDSYFDLDARIAWQVCPNFEMSVVGQNLLQPLREEFGGPLANENASSAIERGFYLMGTVRFD